jgi:NADH-quinone oxidoreductase subunit M
VSHLEIIVLLPLLAALAIGCGAPARITSLIGSGGVLFLSLLLALRFDRTLEGAMQFVSSRSLWDLPGIPKLSLAFGVDGISLVLLLLAAIVMISAVWVAPAEESLKGRARLYYISLLLIGGGAIGAFLATDLFFFYAFHELALIPTFLMIGIFGHGEDRVRVAWTITVFLGVGSLILLVGLLLAVIGLGGQTFDIASLIAAAKNPETALTASTQTWVYGLLLVGFGTLVSLFPFHSWAAPAYAAAPAPVAMLHAGVLKKFGLYGLIRIALPLLPLGAAKWQTVLLVLLLGNILYLGFVTLAQKKLDRMAGTSSVMHMGYIFLGIAAGNVIGISGAVLLMVGHGLSIAAMFGLAGWIRERTGTLEFAKLGGLAQAYPRLGLLFGFVIFASAGLPGFANFAGEVAVFFGAFAGEETTWNWLRWTTVGALWGVVISAVYLLRAYREIFFGPLPAGRGEGHELRWSERIPFLMLIGALLLFGFVPEVLNQFIRPAVEGLFLTTAG